MAPSGFLLADAHTLEATADRSKRRSRPGRSRRVAYFRIRVPKAYWRAAEGNDQNFGDIENYLRGCLVKAGYFEAGTLLLPETHDGFAIVTRLEQTDDKGRPEREEIRWNHEVRPLNEEGFTVTEFLKGLFSTGPGFFRAFVFVFSSEEIHPRPELATREEVIQWNGMGATRLPANVRTKPTRDAHQLTVLVYELQLVRNSPHTAGLTWFQTN